jgi:peptidoglycan/xylan/chitin deacetylase (PgdA/CDA1 family)
LKKKLEMWIDAALSCSPAQPIFHLRASRKLTVLAYHGIEDQNRFAGHLDYLINYMHPVSLEEVLYGIKGCRGLPRRAVLITFDDGDRSLLDVAMPMLRERGIPGVAFVIAGLLDTDTPQWEKEVRELALCGGTAADFSGLSADGYVRVLKNVSEELREAAIKELRRSASGASSAVPQLRLHELYALESAGITVGNHSLTHAPLSTCTEDKIRSEVSRSHESLTAALGHPPKAFAYPNGDADDRIIKMLTSLGYEVAFLFDHRISGFPPSDPLRISRVRVNSYTSLDRFKIIVSGLHPTLYHLRGGL